MNPGPGRQQLPSHWEDSGRSLLSSSRYVCFGDFHLDLQRQQLFRNGLRVEIQGKVFQALVALLEHPGEVVTREVLSSRLWPPGTHVNFNANVNTTVNRLRQVLGDSPEQPAFIETIPRRGYSFIAKVEFVNSPPNAKPQAGAEPRDPSILPLPDPQNAPSPASARARMWFILGLILFVISGALLGAAIAVYANHAFR